MIITLLRLMSIFIALSVSSTSVCSKDILTHKDKIYVYALAKAGFEFTPSKCEQFRANKEVLEYTKEKMRINTIDNSSVEEDVKNTKTIFEETIAKDGTLKWCNTAWEFYGPKGVVVANLLSKKMGTERSKQDSFIGQEFNTVSSGQPICAGKEQINQFIMAIYSGSPKSDIHIYGCTTMKNDTKVFVIDEDKPLVVVGRIVKVRIYGNGHSAVAYTISAGLEQK